MTTGISSVSTTQSALLVGGVQSFSFDQTGIVSGIDAGLRPIGATVNSNALTVNLNQTTLQFRSPTLASGTVSQRSAQGTAPLVCPSGASFGFTNGILGRLLLIAIDATSAGAGVELAVTNALSPNSLDETGLISTTAMSVTATSASLIYSATARTNLPFRVVGFIESTQTTAGAWVNPPTLVQGRGGLALASLGSIGYNQKYYDVTGSRTLGANYVNATGRPILVTIYSTSQASLPVGMTISTDGVQVAYNYSSPGSAGTQNVVCATAIVRHGQFYSITSTGSAPATSTWIELR